MDVYKQVILIVWVIQAKRVAENMILKQKFPIQIFIYHVKSSSYTFVHEARICTKLFFM